MQDPDGGEQKRQAHNPEILEPDDGWQAYANKTASPGFRGASMFYSVSNNDGCLAASITFILFIICVSSFGLLAGIGFFFFHVCIAIIGSVIATRKLMSRQYFNFWQWRICNWLVSFLLVFWLAGS